MKTLLAVVALLASAPSYGQSASTKLILTWSQGGIVVVDYPSAARCEQARQAIEAERERRVAEAERSAARRGGTLVGAPWAVYGICIPG